MTGKIRFTAQSNDTQTGELRSTTEDITKMGDQWAAQGLDAQIFSQYLWTMPQAFPGADEAKLLDLVNRFIQRSTG